ncbi:MAG TPA: N-acetylmuramic acid 6-phosphate etherase [Aggregatilineaceae bacterium]|nr:N-acetylmuramic acid 6-phosphate etherase [Aggregatilineaceae bacterium]
MLTETPNPRTANIDRLSSLEMLQVINDEDASVAVAVQRALPSIARAVDAITACLRRGGHLIYVGAGTSGRLGVLDAVECVPTFSTDPLMVQGIVAGGHAALTQPVEGAEDDYDAGYAKMGEIGVSRHDVVIGIAASGQTPYVIGALQAAKAYGAVTAAVTCNEPAPMLDIVQFPIAAVVGPEIIAGSTRLKAGTAQKMILNMLSTASMIQLGKVYGNLMVDVKVTNQKLAKRAQGIVMKVAHTSEEEAIRLLQQTQNEVKPAIVMALRHVSAEEARSQLIAADGILRRIIGDSIPG